MLIEVEGERDRRRRCPARSRPPPSARLAGLTLPGLANAHSHAFHRALRGRTQTGTGSFWTWREQMYALAAGSTPTPTRRSRGRPSREMALAGITLVGEFHYLHHEPGGSPTPTRTRWARR